MDYISDKLHPLMAVLNTDESPVLDELVKQVEQNQKQLKTIESNLSEISISRSTDNLSSGVAIPRSLTVSEGVKNIITHERAFSEISMDEQIKQLQQTELRPKPLAIDDQIKQLKQAELRPRTRDVDDQYAEIGGLRNEILGGSTGGSLVPGPSVRGPYQRLDLPSPLVESDHVSG